MEQKVEMRGGGWLTVSRDGPRARLNARRPADGKGLYKVWLRGERGEGLLLGTMVPQEGVLALDRTLSLDELGRAGCWPDFRAECVLAFSFSESETGKWYCEPHPERLFTDPLLKKHIPGPMLCCRNHKGFSLAAPFKTDHPFVLPGLFCLASVEKLPSGVRLIWRFDEKGWPVSRERAVEP